MNSMTEGPLFYVGNSFIANLKDIYLVFIGLVSAISQNLVPHYLFLDPQILDIITCLVLSSDSSLLS